MLPAQAPVKSTCLLLQILVEQSLVDAVQQERNDLQAAQPAAVGPSQIARRNYELLVHRQSTAIAASELTCSTSSLSGIKRGSFCTAYCTVKTGDNAMLGEWLKSRPCLYCVRLPPHNPTLTVVQLACHHSIDALIYSPSTRHT